MSRPQRASSFRGRERSRFPADAAVILVSVAPTVDEDEVANAFTASVILGSVAPAVDEDDRANAFKGKTGRTVRRQRGVNDAAAGEDALSPIDKEETRVLGWPLMDSTGWMMGEAGWPNRRRGATIPRLVRELQSWAIVILKSRPPFPRYLLVKRRKRP